MYNTAYTFPLHTHSVSVTVTVTVTVCYSVQNRTEQAGQNFQNRTEQANGKGMLRGKPGVATGAQSTEEIDGFVWGSVDQDSDLLSANKVVLEDVAANTNTILTGRCPVEFLHTSVMNLGA